MSRKPRQFEIGNIYHIINRGIDGRKIFIKPQDYSRFILSLEFFNSTNLIDIWTLVGHGLVTAIGGSNPPIAGMAKRIEEQRKKKSESIIELMAFALMPNHYHLIVREIVVGGVSSYMQKIGGYTGYFNKQYDRKGSLFGSSYKYVEIKTEAQLFVVFNYVHTNPVELVESMWKKQQVKNFDKAKNFLENYKWSSYKDYIGMPTFSNTTDREFFLDLFDREKGCKKEVEDWIKFKADNYIQKDQFNPKDFE